MYGDLWKEGQTMKLLYALVWIVPLLFVESVCAAEVPVVSDADAAKYVGQRVTVQGKVATSTHLRRATDS